MAKRVMSAIFLAALLTWCVGAMPAAAADLYSTKVTVTGQGEPNRMTGFAAALEDVLIKASGAEKLNGDRRLAAYKPKAKDFVKSFSYRDQFFGKPIRDEQGTRDRPFDLTVDFRGTRDRRHFEGRLASSHGFHIGRRSPSLSRWNKARRTFVTTDGSQSDLQREALLAAAEKRGMGIVLPDAAALAKSNITGAELKTPSFPALTPVATELGGEVVLVGHLVWDDRELGWATQWQMASGGQTHRWQMRGLTFDETFRRGIGGAAQILSGNGDPVARSAAATEKKPH